MGLDHADDDVDAGPAPGVRALQHLVGLADAGGGADEDLEPAARALLAARRFQQCLGRRTLFGIAALSDHQAYYSHLPVVEPSRRYFAARSSARFSASTLTRGSPNRPSRRPSVLDGYDLLRPRLRGMLRAFATRGT